MTSKKTFRECVDFDDLETDPKRRRRDDSFPVLEELSVSKMNEVMSVSKMNDSMTSVSKMNESMTTDDPLNDVECEFVDSLEQCMGKKFLLEEAAHNHSKRENVATMKQAIEEAQKSSAKVSCSLCGNTDLETVAKQIACADEGQTVFRKCKCGNFWTSTT